ncbi:uncharacterized protein LOC128221970 isoform X2 [Mya arenaria]|nr:uncharacterized protein LOC128221970 isoform X2 [Mya arenaria]XP_052786656.1 uncharacterized protein LOC128221970 isoform X2 [Mya arenaria]XP_052786657.1 uncharacterized protein LOC128221970 isoform X2 [Mya arenaria]XP_052786658.1 uncharacterized protein LOC128221970 isoform X2 [Mya arenaria]XP_052786659.1 uncharacterized protein LOC128221970 isoform X2 [Mya arenaria]XP_052786660.1 uncharacterized protein LOC128221970 isoform X2 [Mya arenaria]
MTDSTKHQNVIEQAQKLTKEYVELLNEWEPKRVATVARIREIASELQNVKQDVNISKVVGGAVGILGGIAAVAGTILSGGLAAPLFIGGMAAAAAGTATSAGAEIAEHFISKGKLESAQEVLEADKKLTKKIEDKKAEVDAKVKELSNLLRLSKEEVFGALLMSAVPGRGFVHMNDERVFKMLVSAGLLPLVHLTFRGQSVIGKGMAAFEEVSLAGISKVLGSLLTGMAIGAMLVLDVYFLVSSSIELSNGSPSGAADSLRGVATKLEKQAQDLKSVLEQIREETEEYERYLRKKFRKELEKVAVQKCASDDDAKGILDHIYMHSSNEWQGAFLSLNINLNRYAFQIAQVFRIFGRLIEEHLRHKKEQHVEITLIAHGRINLHALVPSQIYYLTNVLKSVTCFSPWGCAVDANVVYGIATNTIRITNLKYSGPVIPGLPGAFNVLPERMDLTPNVIFSPVVHGEGAHQALLQLIALLQSPADGLVIPYFTGVGNDLLPFPEIPLWVCSNVVAICGFLLNVTVSLRVAACLSPENGGAITSFLGTDGCDSRLTQYCQVPMNRTPPIAMTNLITSPQNDIQQLEEIRGHLFL